MHHCTHHSFGAVEQFSICRDDLEANLRDSGINCWLPLKIAANVSISVRRGHLYFSAFVAEHCIEFSPDRVASRGDTLAIAK
jgi:hypothetical protein